MADNQLKLNQKPLKAGGILAASVVFAAAGMVLLSFSSAAPLSTVEINFATDHEKPVYAHYENAMMRHRTFVGGNNTPERQALNEIGVKHERVFVRLDNVQPTLNGRRNYEGNQYTFGDSWLNEMTDNNVAPWLTQEVDDWKQPRTNRTWFIKPPLNTTELNQYEQLWYEIVLRTKEQAPLTEYIEMMNEPDLAKWGLTKADRANLWVRNAKVVNRINAELSLPNETYGTTLKAGGPSFIASNIRNNNFKIFMNDIYSLDIADPEDLKPHFFSYHDLKGGINPSNIEALGTKIQAYMNDPRFGDYWQGVPIWNTAYSVRSSEASNPLTSRLNKQTPSAARLAQSAAGLAASHYYMMGGGVTYGSIFTTTNYLDYTQSVLVPEANTGPLVNGRTIPYFSNGLRRTPLSNLFLMMSKIEGTRAAVSLNGSLTLNASGEGVGAIATKSDNAVFIQAWNYQDSAQTGFDSDVVFKLYDLESAGIMNNESATVNVYVINRTTSNIAHGNNTQDGLELISTVTLAPGEMRTLNRYMTTNEVVLYEIIGNNDEALR